MNDQQIAQTKAKARQLSAKIAGKTAKINHTIAKKRRARSEKSRAKLEARIVRFQKAKSKLEAEVKKLLAKIPEPVYMRRRDGNMARCLGCGKPVTTKEADWRETSNYIIELPACEPDSRGNWREKYVHAFCIPALERKHRARGSGQ
jgi:hypothetical protein